MMQRSASVTEGVVMQCCTCSVEVECMQGSLERSMVLPGMSRGVQHGPWQ